MREAVPLTPEDVPVRESADPLVAAAADAQVHDEAVGDPSDPVGMNRVGERRLGLDEIDFGVVSQDVQALVQVVLEHHAVAVEEEQHVAGGERAPRLRAQARFRPGPRSSN